MKHIVRFASLLSAVMLFATLFSGCEGTGDNNGGGSFAVDSELVLKVDKLIISCIDGTDAATFFLTLNGEPVAADGVSFYDAKGNPLSLDNFTFSTKTAGTYTFWANYMTFNSNIITVEAVPTEVPDTPEDIFPERTDFNRKALMVKFTGKGCGACPSAMDAVHEFYDESEFASRAVIAEAHTFNALQDPAELIGFYSVSTFPTLVVDWSEYTISISKSGIENMLRRRLLDEQGNISLAKAGISVNSFYSDGVITFKVSVKAAETGMYRVGAWLLEDGIAAGIPGQTGGSQPYHDIYDDCLRIADSKASDTNYTGLKMGTIEAGKTGEKMFVWKLDEFKADGCSWNNDWNVDNMKLCVFVSTRDELDNYYVNNVVIAPVNGELKYDYVQHNI